MLKKWKKVLNRKLNDQDFIKSTIKILSRLFNAEPPKTDVNAYLLLSSTSYYPGGGANINDKSITVEISRLPLDKVNPVIGTIWHETIHLLFHNLNQYFYPLLLKHFKRQDADLINEAVNASLFPRGILGIRLLNNEPPNRLMKNIDEKQTIKILNLTKEYIDNNRSFDLNYIKKIARILKIA